jgi:hypothetical protein
VRAMQRFPCVRQSLTYDVLPCATGDAGVSDQ